MNNEAPCFGFYGGDKNAACSRCTPSKRCKSVLIIAGGGFDILGDAVASMIEDLPDTAYKGTDRVSEMLAQILKPPTITQEEEELLAGIDADLDL